MKKILIGCTLSTFLLTFGNFVCAEEIDRAGTLLTKIGIQVVFPTGKTIHKRNNGSVFTDQNGVPYKTKFKNTVGAELAASYFLTDNLATEFSVSYVEFKAKQHNFKDARLDALGLGSSGDQKNIKTRAIPVTLILQYHTPTFLNVLQPYIGAGYSYYFQNGKRSYTKPLVPNAINAVVRIKPKDTHGPVLQVGSNFDLGQNFGLNLDVKFAWL